MPRYTDDQLAIALEECRGMVFLASKRLGCSWNTMDARIKKSARLQAVVAAQSGQVLDLAETKLYDAIAAGELGSIKFILSTKGKARGYVERQELTGGDGGPLSWIGIVPPAPAEPDDGG
jgi:hypothetical protein